MTSMGVNTGISKRRLNMLLLGKTGSGKSATGNTILQRRKFRVSGGGRSVTTEINDDWVETDNHTLHIIDGPGLQDTDLTALRDKERACKNMVDTLSRLSGGINAFVLVVKYGERFTKENEEAVDALKCILGENWLKDFGIVVVTNAADWYADNEKKRPGDWFRKKDEKYHNIFSSCGYRCVFFDNRRPDVVRGGNPVDWVISTVETIANTHGFYTNEHFQNAEAERNRLIAKLKEPILKPEIQEKCSLLTAKIDEVLKMSSPEEKQKCIKDVFRKANALLEEIKQEDMNTGKLARLENMVLRVMKLAQETDMERLKKLGDDIEALRVKHKGRMYTADTWKYGLTGLGILGAVAGVATVATGGLAGIAIGGAVAAGSYAGATGFSIYQSVERRDHQKEVTSKSKYMK